MFVDVEMYHEVYINFPYSKDLRLSKAVPQEGLKVIIFHILTLIYPAGKVYYFTVNDLQYLQTAY